MTPENGSDTKEGLDPNYFSLCQKRLRHCGYDRSRACDGLAGALGVGAEQHRRIMPTAAATFQKGQPRSTPGTHSCGFGGSFKPFRLGMGRVLRASMESR